MKFRSKKFFLEISWRSFTYLKCGEGGGGCLPYPKPPDNLPLIVGKFESFMILLVDLGLCL